MHEHCLAHAKPCHRTDLSLNASSLDLPASLRSTPYPAFSREVGDTGDRPRGRSPSWSSPPCEPYRACDLAFLFPPAPPKCVEGAELVQLDLARTPGSHTPIAAMRCTQPP